MRWMIVDPKLLGNQPGDPPAGPDGALKTKGVGPLAQQAFQLRQLLGTQPRRAARRGMRRQSGAPPVGPRCSHWLTAG
jgi:hypothetical protein